MVISPEPIDLEVTYRRELQQGGQLQQGGPPRGIEKIFAQVTHHRIFKGKNHLHFNMLVSCVNIVLHTTAQWTRDNPQYEGYGDWSHFNNWC